MLESQEFFFHYKGFSDTDTYHSDIKIRARTVERMFFYLLKIIFENFQIFLQPNGWEIKKFFFDLLTNVKNSNSVSQDNIKTCVKVDQKC